MKKQKIYQGIDTIPNARANEQLCKGTLVLEGGAWRGIYTQGALDAFMECGINMTDTIGVSAGAMSAMSYVSGQIGRSARLNLRYRHDPQYCGLGAMHNEHGVTGFHYLFEELSKEEPLDMERFMDPKRRFTAVATDIETGEAVYFEKGKCSDIFAAVQASATVPYVSRPVTIDGLKYLDGGIAEKIPLEHALHMGNDKIVVIRTRDRSYRKPLKSVSTLIRCEYRKYPALAQDLLEEAPRYNLILDELDRLEQAGELFVLAPSEPIHIRRFEGDMETLGHLYWLGYQDAMDNMEALKAYLAK